VGQLLLDLHQQEKTMLLVVTHSSELAKMFPRRLEMVDGTLHAPGGEEALKGTRRTHSPSEGTP
jgi:ABC-type lipoprotein export system ATPase subunit